MSSSWLALFVLGLKVVPLHPRAATLVLNSWMEQSTTNHEQYADIAAFGAGKSDGTRGFVALKKESTNTICALAALTAEPLQIVHLASNDGESATRLLYALIRSCEGNMTLHADIDPRWRIALAFIDE